MGCSHHEHAYPFNGSVGEYTASIKSPRRPVDGDRSPRQAAAVERLREAKGAVDEIARHPRCQSGVGRRDVPVGCVRTLAVDARLRSPLPGADVERQSDGPALREQGRRAAEIWRS
jgi:hypothetical protein